MKPAFFALFSMLFLAGCVSVNESACPDCNVILISIDTLRADHVGAYGYDKNTTPNIDRIAKEGYVFTNVRSESSWTAPSHLAMLFSRHPYDLQYYIYNYPIRPNSIPDEEVSLAEVLRKQGYRTHAFTGDAYVSKDLGFDQGFEQYFDAFDMGGFEKYLEDAFVWIDEQKNEKYFLFLHGYNPHIPYDPPSEYLQGSFNESKFVAGCERPPLDAEEFDYLLARYDGDIRHTDAMIGELWQKLVETGQAEKTILVITSDHGEEFYEHGRCNHIDTLYDESIRVPLIMRLPDKMQKQIDTPVQLSDIYPTILEMVGVPLRHKIDGKSLVPILSGLTNKSRPQFSVTQQFRTRKKSVVIDEWKLIETNPPWRTLFINNTWTFIQKDGIDAIKLHDNEVFFVSLDDFNNRTVYFSAKTKADNATPVTLKFGIEAIPLWKDKTLIPESIWVDLYFFLIKSGMYQNNSYIGFKEASSWKARSIPSDEWVQVDSSEYLLEPDKYQLQAVIDPLGGAVLIDEFSLIDASTQETLMNFVFDGNDKTYELYDLNKDPGEQTNLINSHPDIYDAMKKELDGFFSERNVQETAAAELREEVKEQLKALGYIT